MYRSLKSFAESAEDAERVPSSALRRDV